VTHGSSLIAERKTGLKTVTSTVQVVYDFGEFELTLETDGWGKSPEEMQALIRKPLLEFIEAMRIAAEGEIIIPKPPQSPVA
jgi:hypothetical protein